MPTNLAHASQQERELRLASHAKVAAPKLAERAKAATSSEIPFRKKP